MLSTRVFRIAALGAWLAPAIAPAAGEDGIPEVLRDNPEFRRYLEASMEHAADVAAMLKQDGYGTTLEDLEAIYGQKPMRSVAYLTNIGGEVGRAILSGAALTGVEPAFLAVALFQEGLNRVVDEHHAKYERGQYSSETLLIDGWAGIGADSFAGEMETLKRKGYLRKDYDGIERSQYTYGNERGDVFQHFTFRGFAAAAEGVGAFLKMRRDQFLSDAEALGIPTAEMTPVQIDQWTYLYYNAGAGTGRRMLAQTRGAIPTVFRRTKLENAMRNPFFNAARVGASSAFYRMHGVFSESAGSNADRHAETTAAATVELGSHEAWGAGLRR